MFKEKKDKMMTYSSLPYAHNPLPSSPTSRRCRDQPVVSNDCSNAYHRTCSGLSRDAAQATGRALGALPPPHLHLPILLQAVLLLNQNTIKAGTH